MTPLVQLAGLSSLNSEVARLDRISMPWEASLRFGILTGGEVPRTVTTSRRAWQNVYDLMERLTAHITQREPR